MLLRAAGAALFVLGRGVAPDASGGVRRPAEPPSRFVLGGLGTGTLEWRADGSFANAALMHNAAFAVASIPGSFMAIWVSCGDRSDARVLAQRSPYGLPCVSPVRATHRYPVGTLEWSDGSLPVHVAVRAWSPLIPQDTVASSLPLVILSAQVRNDSDQAAAVSVAMSWESTLGLGGAPGLGAFARRTGVAAHAVAPQERTTGIGFAGPPITDAAVDDMRLHNGRGEQVVLTEYPSASAAVTSTAWNALDRVPSWWDAFSRTGEVTGGGDCVGVEGQVHPAGCVATKVSLSAGESREYVFAVAWRQDRFYDAGGASWIHPSSRMFSDASAVARYGLANRQALLALSTEWQSRVERSGEGAARLAAMCAELADAVHSVDVRAEEDAPRALRVSVDRRRTSPDEAAGHADVALLTSYPSCDAEDLRRRAESLGAGPLPGGFAQGVLAHAWLVGDRAWASGIWPHLRPAVGGLVQGEQRLQTRQSDLRAMADLAALANDIEMASALRTIGAARPLDEVELLGTSAWASWLTWTGCTYNRLSDTLEFDTGRSDAATSRRAAVFHPAFWGWTEWRRLTRGAEFMLRVDRTMGPPRGSALPIAVEGLAGAPGIRVQRVYLRLPNVPRSVSVTAMHGVTPVPCKVDVDEGYGVRVTPEQSLELRTGDRFNVSIVWASPRGG